MQAQGGKRACRDGRAASHTLGSHTSFGVNGGGPINSSRNLHSNISTDIYPIITLRLGSVSHSSTISLYLLMIFSTVSLRCADSN